MQSDDESDNKGIHPVDFVLMLVVLSFSAALVLLDRFAIPAFINTYKEFSSDVPFVTRAVLSHVVPLGAAVAAVIVGALGMVARHRGSNALALSLGLAGIAIGLGGIVFCFYALYVPVFDMAGKIQP